MAPALRVALTGGIATGKSRCLSGFASLGVPTIDADQLAREVVEPGTAGFSALVARFGSEILNPEGEVDRDRLGRIVFRDPAARRDLEALIHPAVYAAITSWFERPPASDAPVAMADIPLLFETGRRRDFDRVVVTACTPEQQLARLLARGALSERDARLRIDAQLPTAVKTRDADYVIDTSGTLEDTDRQVIEVWQEISAQALLMRQWGNEAMGQ